MFLAFAVAASSRGHSDIVDDDQDQKDIDRPILQQPDIPRRTAD